MEIRTQAGDVSSFQTEGAVVFVFEEGLTAGAAAVDRALDGAISRLREVGEVRPKPSHVALLHSLGRLPAERIAVVGLGKRGDFEPDRLRGATADGLKALRKATVRRMAVGLPDVADRTAVLAPETLGRAAVEGAILGLYRFREFKTTPPDEPEVDEVVVLPPVAGQLAEMAEGGRVGRILAEATTWARDLVNMPANRLKPADLAEAAVRMAREFGLAAEVLETSQIEELGMGALLSVAQGSASPPRLIVLRHRAGDAGGGLGLIGKGVTFDSGGISIKPAENMDQMKGDMAGGAATLAAMRAIAQLRPRLNVTALVPAVENMPSGTATRPGDVVRAMNGKTIEVLNTDAEGRVILADAICYARRLGLSPLVDSATLTGACVIALGTFCAGAFTNDEVFQTRVIEAGREAGERLWPLPMYEEYDTFQLRSEVADVPNVSSGARKAGAIIGAKFLQRFAEDTPWVHLDIAGTSFVERGWERTYLPRGGTGFGARTLAHLALRLAGG
ncbi:MAG: leucyl aminopeptidase [Chloroflexi bacterium]|nr:leucyl aminopeptidase [Chloroflexota bacterium]